MSSFIYAGHLCLTHVGDGIEHPDLDGNYEWIIKAMSMSTDHNSVTVHAIPVWPLENRPVTRSLRLLHDAVVTVYVRGRKQRKPDQPHTRQRQR